MAALACLVCDSPAAGQAWAVLTDGPVADPLLAVGLPFAVLFAAVALLHFGFGWPRSGRGG